jgi:hypothetical protein
VLACLVAGAVIQEDAYGICMEMRINGTDMMCGCNAGEPFHCEPNYP